MTQPRYLSLSIPEPCNSFWWKAALLWPVSFLCAALHAQQIAQTEPNSFTTAEKDSVFLALVVSESSDVVINDSITATNSISENTDSGNLYNWIDEAGLCANRLYVEPGIGTYCYYIPPNEFTITIPEVSIAAYTPIESNAVAGYCAFDYEEYLYIQRLRTIAEMITRYFAPQTHEIEVNHPASDSHAGILPPETRVAVPESRKRTKNNPRA